MPIYADSWPGFNMGCSGGDLAYLCAAGSFYKVSKMQRNVKKSACPKCPKMSENPAPGGGAAGGAFSSRLDNCFMKRSKLPAYWRKLEVPPEKEHSCDAKQGANHEDPDRRYVGKRPVPSAPGLRESQRHDQRPE
jgi:hypothetical protein